MEIGDKPSMVVMLVIHITTTIMLVCQNKASLLAPLIAMPGCHDHCGNVSIPYPFGIGSDCYYDDEFSIICNTSFNPPKPFLAKFNLELLEISLDNGNVRIKNTMFFNSCSDSTDTAFSLNDTKFYFSDSYNRFTATGCGQTALIQSRNKNIGGCVSVCNVITEGKDYSGVDFCQTDFPPFLQSFNAYFRGFDDNENDTRQCMYAFIVDEDWFRKYNVTKETEYVPIFLDWEIKSGCSNPFISNSSSHSSVCSRNAYCSGNDKDEFYRCSCNKGYGGNPYLPNGCQDIDECTDPRPDNCSRMVCSNYPGGYSCSPCPKGQLYIREENKCSFLNEFHKRNLVKVILGTIGGVIGLLGLLVGGWWIYKAVQTRRNTKLKEKFFKRNGGLLLQQQLTSSEGNIEKTKMFSSMELEKATDHYNANRVLGQGGQGMVYKGMMPDGMIVAIKKSKVVDGSQLEQFINEVVILSQISHRNVVKLLGCCLETEVPLLVYEFVPNGSLYQHIHDPSEEFPLTWEMRLRISTEAAAALSYLHSAASISIYHRDIKSMNILLDDKYKAKVSDFGTSRSVAVDQTHFTTRVQGTIGYLDPEYYLSNRFTEKSDVYSFGVVLVELLTGQKPISSNRVDEDRNLATYFISSMGNNRLFEILDTRVLKEGGKEEIMAVAGVARRCLNPKGKKRPTMKEVATELEYIKSQGTSINEQNHQELDEDEDDAYDSAEIRGPDTTSTFSASHSDVQPRLFA